MIMNYIHFCNDGNNCVQYYICIADIKQVDSSFFDYPYSINVYEH